MPVSHTVRFRLNGNDAAVTAHPMERLLDVLREQLQLTGTKEGCGEGECGACSVIVNGEVVMSCLVPVCQVEGAEIETIEGIALEGELHPVQKAFLETGGAQCGICTPGMIMAAVAHLRYPGAAPGGVVEALEGNICRCTGYIAIFDAVERARKEIADARAGV